MKKIMHIKIVLAVFLILSFIIMIGCDAKLTSPSDDDIVTSLEVVKDEDGKVKLTWNYAVTTDDTLEYHIYRKVGEADFSNEPIGYSTYEDRFYYDNINTNDNSVYVYRIAIYNVTLDKLMPTSDIVAYLSEFTNPSDLTIEQIEQNVLRITWVDECIGEEGYYVDKKEGDGSWQNRIATLAANSTSYLDSTTLFETFSYRVRPFYASDSAGGTTTSILPLLPAPSHLAVELLANDDIFRLTWQDNSDGEEGFEVQRKIGHLNWGDVSPWNEALFSELVTEENIEFAQDDLSLLYFQTADVAYRVRAFQGEFFSEWSEQVETKIRMHNIGGIQTSDIVKDMSVDNYTLYLANNYEGVKVIDVSSPNNPSEIATYDLEDRTNGVYVKGNILYALHQQGGFIRMDIEDPTNPQNMGDVTIPGVLNSIYVHGVTNNVPLGYAFVARGVNGLSVIEFMYGEPEMIDTITGIDAKKIFVPDNGNYAFVAVGSYGGFRIIDLSNSGNYQIDFSYETSGSAQDIFVQGDFAYIANGQGGLEIVNITNMSNPQLESVCHIDGFVKRVVVENEYAFVLDAIYGLYVVNISDKSNPFIQSSYELTGNPTALEVLGDYLYVSDDNGIHVIQVFE